MSRYKAELVVKEGFNTIELSDAGLEATAIIVPEVGNNLVHFTINGIHVIMPPESLHELVDGSNGYFKYGTPILFPPNRVKNGSFSYKGQSYQLPLNEPPSHHLHGEISCRPWEVMEFGASDEQGAFVTSRFQFAAHSEIIAYFPHMLTFIITYRLYEGSLICSGSIYNEGSEESPFAFGLHPYFYVPFDTNDEIVLQIPAAAEWPITNQSFVLGEPTITTFSESLNEGIAISDYAKLGCSLVNLQDEDRTCYIEMRNRNYKIAYQIDPIFPFILMFRPDWASAFSLEPYTYLTDGFNLPYDHSVTGVKGILPGEVIYFTNRLWIE
ncbi:aldose 1-epimerase [Paenibacillus psychroresistens]|uniref:Aldose 1-epimerase n=1 Tax=Paenibacillus psychroresistens TaxID=1778678 RepID=A0A6B8RIN0_9BACL|nr:aldose 1-epimerase [Paenibacillus psychroresistens]QGQ96110.1 aldose 1-epimerase [Paenibacillus psychroresistens]